MSKMTKYNQQKRLYHHELSILTHTEYQQHLYWMNYALKIARIGSDLGEVPIGAVIINSQGKLVSSAANRKFREQDPTAHAEIVAIKAATRARHTCYLQNCTLYVTLEPCPMCAGAIIQSRIGLLVYGADDPKTGAIRTAMNLPDSHCSNHRLSVLGGINQAACRQQLHTWFQKQRASSSHLS